MSRKLTEYKPNPLVELFKKAELDNPNFLLIPSIVDMKTETWTIDKLYWHYTNNRITSLPPYLQRVLLDFVWGASNHKKAKSYIRSIWRGLGCLTPMTIIPIDLVLRNVEEKIANTSQMEILKQLKRLRTAIKKAKNENVQFINIDGQSRSKCGIVPYLKGEFNLSSDDFTEPIDVYNSASKQLSDVTIHKFTELQKFQKAAFLSQEVAINIINRGTLQQVSDALIAINSNEKWKEWQQIYNNAEPTLLKYAINEVMSNAPIRDFLTNRLRGNTRYKPEFSGWEWFVAEQLSWLTHTKTINMSLLKDISSGNQTSPDKKQIGVVKDMINIWIDEYKNKNAVNPTHLSTWIAFRDVLANYNNKQNPFYMVFGNIPQTNVLSEGQFLNWYLSTITKFESKVKEDSHGRLVLNSEHWVKDSSSDKHSSAPEGWPAHCEGGMKLVSITGRLRWLLDSFKSNYQSLINDGTISDQVGMNDMQTIIVANDFIDSDGDEINLTRDEVLERGHDQSVKNEGSNKLHNVKPQKKKSNRSYSGRDMISKEK